MAGLVAYASSDEEDEVEQPQQIIPHSKIPETKQPKVVVDAKKNEAEPSSRTAPSEEKMLVVGPIHQNAVPLGPSLPPVEDSYTADPNPDQVPGSPYSQNRAILHDLTLPSVPNMDIPPSPPGSPPPATNKKFEQFLDLKKKGVHFNSKLESSAALRNPGLMDKLMSFVQIDERSQYETTLPAELWDPKAFPDWAFRGRLKKSQEKIAKDLELERISGGRTTVDFVGSSTSSGVSTATAGGITRGEKRKGGWK